jgi:hypothetical protein
MPTIPETDSILTKWRRHFLRADWQRWMEDHYGNRFRRLAADALDIVMSKWAGSREPDPNDQRQIRALLITTLAELLKKEFVRWLRADTKQAWEEEDVAYFLANLDWQETARSVLPNHWDTMPLTELARHLLARRWQLP